MSWRIRFAAWAGLSVLSMAVFFVLGEELIPSMAFAAGACYVLGLWGATGTWRASHPEEEEERS